MMWVMVTKEVSRHMPFLESPRVYQVGRAHAWVHTDGNPTFGETTTENWSETLPQRLKSAKTYGVSILIQSSTTLERKKRTGRNVAPTNTGFVCLFRGKDYDAIVMEYLGCFLNTGKSWWNPLDRLERFGRIVWGCLKKKTKTR